MVRMVDFGSAAARQFLPQLGILIFVLSAANLLSQEGRMDPQASQENEDVTIAKIPLGGSVNLSQRVIGKVYVPTKWGGQLNLSGSNVELFYTDGSDLDVDTAMKIYKGELDSKRVANGNPCDYTVPKDKYGWYYVKITAISATAISATFQQAHTVAKAPWSCPWYPYSEDQSPHLYATDGCLAKYDRAFASRSRDVERRNMVQVGQLGFMPGGHYIAQKTLKETNAEVTLGRDLSGNGTIDADIQFDFWNNDTKTIGADKNIQAGDIDAKWWGHCDQATAVIICENAPTGDKQLNGETFTPADKKGLLVALYHDFTIDPANKLGPSIVPHAWHGFLEKRILGDDKMFGCDIFFPDNPNTYNEIWNYPIYSLVNADYKQKPNQTDEKVIEITCEVRYWKSTADPPAGESLYYKYNVAYSDGEAFSSQTSDWLDPGQQAPANYKRPDTVWVPNPQTGIDPNGFWFYPGIGVQLDYDNIRLIVPAP